MSRRKAPTITNLADGAAAGRRVVVSVGTLDGPFLAALAKVRLVPNGNIGDPSTWGPGVHQDGEIANAIGDKQTSTGIANPCSNTPEGGAKHGANQTD